MVGYRPLDFGTNFLMILISNFLLYLLYYAITKCIYREVSHTVASFRPLGFFLLSIIFWSIGVYSYLLVSQGIYMIVYLLHEYSKEVGHGF
jgi:hypothetical protein